MSRINGWQILKCWSIDGSLESAPSEVVSIDTNFVCINGLLHVFRSMGWQNELTDCINFLV